MESLKITAIFTVKIKKHVYHTTLGKTRNKERQKKLQFYNLSCNILKLHSDCNPRKTKVK